MKQTRQYFLYVVVSIFIIGVSLGTGYRLGRAQAESIKIPLTVSGAINPEVASTTDFALFWKVWNILDEKYAVTKKHAPITDQDKLYGAIQGLAAAYGDPYTTFFPPAESKQFDSQIDGSFEGVGMEVSQKDGILTVVAPLKGSPAEKAGIQAGDKILKIDSTVTTDLSVDQAVTLIRGKKGTTIKLTVFHKDSDQPSEISIIRDTINVPTIENKDLGNGIYKISLFEFSAPSANLFKTAINAFVQSGDKNLIVDLRGNPGGYLDSAVDIASWFLPAGNVVVSEEFKNGDENVYHRSKGYDINGPNYKTVILIDGGSASASEILAGALHEYDKATLVGTKSFGKGSVQEYMKVSPDTSLKVTVARWLTPKGLSISEEGLAPDVEVKITKDDINKGKDPQLDKAIQILLTK